MIRCHATGRALIVITHLFCRPSPRFPSQLHSSWFNVKSVPPPSPPTAVSTHVATESVLFLSSSLSHVKSGCYFHQVKMLCQACEPHFTFPNPNHIKELKRDAISWAAMKGLGESLIQKLRDELRRYETEVDLVAQTSEPPCP